MTVSEYKLDEDTPIPKYVLYHGVIKHGSQYIAPDDPETRRIALTYYGRTSGVGRVLERLQQERPRMRVGVIGLGVGTMAAYARQDDAYRFYEINPIIKQLSEEGGYFTYLTDARQRGASVEVIMGDGRLSLERNRRKNSTCWCWMPLAAIRFPLTCSRAKHSSSTAGTWPPAE